MGEPSPLDLPYSIVGTFGFPTTEGANQYQYTTFDSGHIPMEFAGHSCLDAFGINVHGTIGMFKWV